MNTDNNKKENEKKLSDISRKIIVLSRNMLTVELRFLDRALSMLKYEESKDIGTVAANGDKLYYSPSYIAKKYLEQKENIPRIYLHSIMHCVLKHFYVGKKIDKALWNIACDIAVENIILDLDLESTSIYEDSDKIKILSDLSKKLPYMNAEVIYNHLKKGLYSKDVIEKLKDIFKVDEHSLWYEEKKKDDNKNKKKPKKTIRLKTSKPIKSVKSNSELAKKLMSLMKEKKIKGLINPEELDKIDEIVLIDMGEEVDNDFGLGSGKDIDKLMKQWDAISLSVQSDIENFSKLAGDSTGNLIQNLDAINREKYDYSSFLKKFAVMGEVMKINNDEFDYIFYTYGMELYNDMPLIEPLEYKDDKRIKEFVIAIDTSGSVQGEPVQKFIQKTYNILKQEENYFKTINIHIVQCDTQIQEDTKITTQQQLEKYLESMTLRGFGGTDFRPVFEYVDELIERREFTNLNGLIYFTDGF